MVEAVVSVFGKEKLLATAKEIAPSFGQVMARELLEVVADIGGFVPFIALDGPAKSLLRIWNALDRVKVCVS